MAIRKEIEMNYEYPLQVYCNDEIRAFLFKSNMEKPIKEQSAQELLEACPERWTR